MNQNVGKEVVDIIKLDLPRTFPDNQRISGTMGRRTLARMLIAVARQYPEIGYCQACPICIW